MCDRLLLRSKIFTVYHMHCQTKILSAFVMLKIDGRNLHSVLSK